MKPSNRKVLAYAAAPVLVAIALAFRLLALGTFDGPEMEAVLLAVALAGFLGGLGPAFLATATGIAAEVALLWWSSGSALLATARDRLELLVFAVSGVLVGLTFEYLLRSRDRERRTREEAVDARRRESETRRTLEMITRCNEVILRAGTEEELYEGICDVVVRVGGYRMCWAGVAENDARRTVRPVARAGHDDGYVAQADVVWDDAPRGRGPIGAALREGHLVVGQVFDTDPSLAPWREEARRRGYASVTAVPVMHGGERLGVLAVYSELPMRFSDEELRFLQVLASDVGFGVGALRQRTAQVRQGIELLVKEGALKASETKFRTYVEAAPVGIFVTDRAGRYLDGNPAALEILGVDAGTLRKLAIADVTEPEDLPRAAAEFQRLLAAGRLDSEYRLRRADGRSVPITLRAVKLDDDHFMAFCQDDTARRAAERARAERDSLLTTVVAAAIDGIWLVDGEGRILEVNDAYCAMSGYSRAELLRMRIPDVEAVEEPEVIAARIAMVRERGFDRFETRHRRKDGSTVELAASGRLLDPASGRMVCFFLDVTERNRAARELREIQAKLARTARLAAMGTLVTGVAHEINNPLTGLTANVGGALEEVTALRDAFARGEPPALAVVAGRTVEVAEMLSDAASGAERIASIVKDLSLFGLPDQKRTVTRLADVVSWALGWLPSWVGEAAEVTAELGEAPAVLASASQMGQVVVNLVTNAALAIPDGRRGHVRVRLGVGAPGTVRLEVIDDGHGIAPGNLDRIFDPFFTTRPKGKGTGLGLSICSAIVGAHGGTIAVASTPGVGTTFRIELPVSGAEA